MVDMFAKFDEEAHNDLVFIVFTSLFPYMSIVTLNFDLWPVTSKINRVHPLTIANMSEKFYEEAHTSLVSSMFTS